MKIDQRPEFLAVILTPEAGDEPDDLEDLIHDEITKGRSGKAPGEKGDVVNVVLDLSQAPQPPLWLKACGPQIPDANLRIVLSPEGFVIARMLKLDAVFEWYSSVESALTQGV